MEIDVAKADWIWPTVLETGRERPVTDGAPTVRPSCRSDEVTCAMVAGVAPKRWANSEAVRKWWYSGEAGSETAFTSAASAAGSRGFKVTTSGSAVVVGAGPTNVAPGGTRPWCPDNLSRPATAAAAFAAGETEDERAGHDQSCAQHT